MFDPPATKLDSKTEAQSMGVTLQSCQSLTGKRVEVLNFGVLSLLGALAIFPTIIDSNGVGISFTIDSLWNRFDAVVLAQILWRRGVIDWLAYPAPFHAKLYSLSFALFDPWSS